MESRGNFSSLCYEAILHKTSIAVKCWGLLIGEGVVPYRGLQSSTDGNSTSCGSVPFLFVSVCFFSKCFLLLSRKGNWSQSLPFQVPLAAFFLDVLQVLVVGQGAACYLVAAWTTEGVWGSSGCAFLFPYLLVEVDINKTSTSSMWQAWSMFICHLTWLAFYCLNHEWCNMYLFLLSWAPRGSWDIK